MPRATARVCPKCRQAHSNPKGCPTCRPPWRGSSYAGGSTRRGRRLRQQVLEEQPICAIPGCRRLSAEVDHIVNLAAGGERYDRANCRGLCEPHHREKTAREAQAGRQRTAPGVGTSQPRPQPDRTSTG
ncbi:MAG: HNH endonuclease [Rhodococcus sp.]|nr:HNH endonuclease [Rhodococcus sp. (in: high G+C Gram-positive bacteria)]